MLYCTSPLTDRWFTQSSDWRLFHKFFSITIFHADIDWFDTSQVWPLATTSRVQCTYGLLCWKGSFSKPELQNISNAGTVFLTNPDPILTTITSTTSIHKGRQWECSWSFCVNTHIYVFFWGKYVCLKKQCDILHVWPNQCPNFFYECIFFIGSG